MTRFLIPFLPSVSPVTLAASLASVNKLIGLDTTWKPFREQRPSTEQQRTSFVNGLEERYRADYAFYAGSGAVRYDGRTVEALALSRSVLEKFYYQNARRIILKPGR